VKSNPIPIVFMLLLSNFAWGQETFSSDTTKRKPMALIGLSLGLSFPIGSFASNDLPESGDAYADMGVMYSLDLAYRISKHLRASGSFIYARNNFDERAASGEFSFPNYLGKSDLTQGINVSAVEADKPYEIAAFMVGPSLTTEGSVLDFQLSFLFGFAHIYSPEVRINNPPEQKGRSSKSVVTSARNPFVLCSKRNQSFGGSAGFDFNFHLTKKLDLSTSMKVIIFANENANRELIAYDNSENIIDVEPYDQNVSYQAFVVSMGINYRFLSK